MKGDTRQAILVNGVPASGKSRLVPSIVSNLRDRGVFTIPLALDTVKEGLFVHIGTGDRAHNRMLGRASYEAIFNLICDFPKDVVPVIDAWHGFQPEDVLAQHLERSGIDHVVEVWCDVSPESAARRYRQRSAKRPEGHLPASYADELFELASRAEPRSFGPVLRVSGEEPVPDLFFEQLFDLLRRS